MTPLEVIDCLFSPDFAPPPDVCPFDVFRLGEKLPRKCTAILYYAVVAELSGWLDDATTPLAAVEAVKHGLSLHSAGVLTDDDVRQRLTELAEEAERDAAKALRRQEAQQIRAGFACPN